MLVAAMEPETALRDALSRADQEQANLERYCADLAAGLDPAGTVEAALRETLSKRDAALHALGRAVFLWVRQGGLLVLEDAADVPPPAEVAPLAGEEPAPEPPEPCPAPPVGALTPEPAPPPTPAAPASPESLAALQRQGLTARWKQEGPPLRPVRLERVLADIGAPIPVADERQAQAQLERLLACNPHAWRNLSTATQRALCGLLAAWARHLQETLLGDSEGMKKLFARLADFSEMERLGFVHGLAQAHRPQRGSWLEDARAHLRKLRPESVPPASRAPHKALERLEEAIEARKGDLRPEVEACLNEGVSDADPRLLRLLAPRLEGLGSAPRLKKLRKNLRAWLEEERHAPAPAAPWPRAAQTAGWRVCLVGGNCKAELRDRLQETFSFAEVTWETGHQRRRIQSLRERIRRRQIDLCLLVSSFISHTVADPVVKTCKAAGVPFLTLGGGNGVCQVRDALEAMLAAQDAEE